MDARRLQIMLLFLGSNLKIGQAGCNSIAIQTQSVSE